MSDTSGGEKEDEDDKFKEEEEANMAREELNRQVEKRHWFTLYEKMAAVRQIQQPLEVGDLSFQAACQDSNLQHNKFITSKERLP